MGALRKARIWQPITVDDFFALPDDPTHKRAELMWGELTMMSPPMPRHGVMQVNLGFQIKGHIRNRNLPCRAGSEVGVVPDFGQNLNYLQPDVVITCEKLDPDARTFKEPVIIIEILSPGNERETRTRLSLYIAMPSVSEIVFIDSSRIRAEIWRKSEQGEWATGTEIIGKGDVFRLASISFETPIEALYEDTGLV
jgi:Uma2 family endonuclease